MDAVAIFAHRLATARTGRGLSQRALGAALGLGPETGGVRINRYERRTASPSLSVVSEIAQVLELPLPYFFTESEELAELIRAFATCNDSCARRSPRK